MGKGSWHEIGTDALRVYSLAYLGDRGLVWEPGTCLLLQQLWLDYRKLMGLHVSICSLKMVKITVSQSGFGSVQSQTSKQMIPQPQEDKSQSLKCATCWQLSAPTALPVRLWGPLVRLPPFSVVWLWTNCLISANLSFFIYNKIRNKVTDLIRSMGLLSPISWALYVVRVQPMAIR